MFRRILPMLFVVCFVGLLSGCGLVGPVFGIKGTLNVKVSFAGGEGQLEKVEIIVDEKFWGNIDPKAAHAFFDLTAGDHFLLVKCPGYVSYRRMIHVGSGPHNLTVCVELKKLPQK